MSVNQFIPEIWADQINEIFKKNLVYGNLLNTDYTGVITGLGDTVKINEIGDIAIADYNKNSTADPTIQVLSDAQVTLKIDRARQFNFMLDDVDNAQTNPKLMNSAMSRSAYNMRDDVDTYIAQQLSTTGNFFMGINSTELGSTVTVLSAASTAIFTALSWYARIMDQNNIPSNGRWIVCPPAIIQQMVMARIIAETANTPAIEQGAELQKRGRAFNFDIYESNNCYGVPSSQWHVIAGHPMAASFAYQITAVESYRSHKGFMDVVRGLYVYGSKVVKPTGIIKGILTSS
jgi:hypothetical protein